MKWLLALLVPLAACATAPDLVPDLARARTELLALHAEQRRLHLVEDAPAFAALLDLDYHELRDGAVLQPTRADIEARFRAYFEAVEFLAWDDLVAPEIALSADGTLATMAVTKVVRTRDVHDGEPCLTRTVFAWLATCVRRPAGWRIAAVASTRAPNDADTALAALRHALGGAGRIAALHEVRASYTCRAPDGRAYRIELALPRTGTWRIAWQFPGEPVAAYEFVGREGWFLGSDGTRTPLAPAEADMVRAHAFPWLALEPESFFDDLTRVDAHVEGERTLERLVAAAPASAALELDLATDLPARLELVDARTDPPAPVLVRFERWHAQDGLLLPARVVAVDAKGEWTMELEQAELEFEGRQAGEP